VKYFALQQTIDWICFNSGLYEGGGASNNNLYFNLGYGRWGSMEPVGAVNLVKSV